MARWCYDGTAHAPSFLQMAEPDDALFVVNSFSKPWAMTGWRIGWLVHPDHLAEQMSVSVDRRTTPAPTTFAQWGALAALSPQGDAFRAVLLERCREGYDVTRRFVDVPEPHPLDSAARRLLRFPASRRHDETASTSPKISLRNARVGVAPGSAFAPPDDAAADSYVRICFAQDANRCRPDSSASAGSRAAL